MARPGPAGGTMTATQDVLAELLAPFGRDEAGHRLAVRLDARAGLALLVCGNPTVANNLPYAPFALFSGREGMPDVSVSDILSDFVASRPNSYSIEGTSGDYHQMDCKRMLRFLTFTAPLLMVVGCVDSRAKYEAAMTHCMGNYPPVVGAMVVYQQCIIHAESPLYPQYDEREFTHTARISLAEQVDRRQISIREADRRFSKLKNE